MFDPPIQVDVLFSCLHTCIIMLQALRARYIGEPYDEAWHLLKAKHWDESHKVLLQHIAADAIINGE